MTTVYLGIDVSKGYADFVAMNEAGSELGGWGRFDDTRAGHDQVQARMAAVWARAPETQVVVGVESTGGYERNWLGLCHRLRRAGWALTAYRLNPLVVKRYHERQLHRTVTDRVSAAGIAAYLRTGRRRQDQLWVAGELEGALTLYRTVRRLVRLQADLQNQLQALLSRCHPELVACLRGGLRQWVLALLRQYPTAAALAQADPAVVARIPYVTPAAAARLVAAAAASVADQTDPATGRAVMVLVDEIAHLRLQVRRLQTELAEQLRADPGVQIIDSIPGFGIWSAICLRLELGDIHRFPRPAELVAFAGLDPQHHQSGDTTINRGISHRGQAGVRAILYPVVRAAIRCNPAVGALYTRLRARGKTDAQAVVAGMRKLLHLVFACWVQGVAFDPSRWEQVAGKAQEMAQRAAMAPTSAAAVPLATCLAAPVSKREAKRRKAAHSPQGPCGVVPQKRPEFERPPSALIIPIRTPSCQGDHAPDFSSC